MNSGDTERESGTEPGVPGLLGPGVPGTEPLKERLPNIANKVLIGFFLAFCFWAVLFPLTNTDIWWHLSGGRYTVENTRFIYEDPFSYAPEKSLWTNLHWLFQLFAYLVYSVSGVKGLILAKAAVFSASCLLLVLAVYKRATLPFCVALYCALVYYMRFLVLVRPIIFSLLYLASFVLIVETFRRNKGRRLLWLLPAVQVLWTNTQGLFLLGPATVLCYLVGDAASLWLSSRRFRFMAFDAPLSRKNLRTLFFFFLGTCAACLASPYGLRGLELPALLFSRIEPSLAGIYSWNVSENVPSWFIQETAPYTLAHLKWFGILAFGSFVLARKRLSVPHFLLLGAYFYLGLIAKRNLSLYFFVLGPVTVANVNAALEEGQGRAWVKQFLPRLRLYLICTAAAGVMFLVFGAAIGRSAARNPETLGLAPFRYPVEAAAILKEEPFEGNVFNSVRYGGYLIWHLYPQKKVFADGRLAIRSREQFREYLNLLDDPSGFPECRKRYGITRVVIPTAVFLRYLPLAGMLYHDDDWSLVYCDGACALFAFGEGRQLPPIDLFSARGVTAIEEKLERKYSNDPYVLETAKRNLAVFLISLGSFNMAERILNPLPSADSKRHLARCYYFQGRILEAQILSEELLEEQPNDTNSLNLLGQTWLDAENPERALEYFMAAIEADPYNRWANEAVKQIDGWLLKHPEEER